MTVVFLLYMGVDLLYIGDPKGIKFMTRLRLGLSHLREHKLKHSFRDSINPLSNCGYEVESTAYFFRQCLLFMKEALSF